ncbi:extracellular solute-binding protein [Streptomyces sp. NRRL WC-3742]|uniref:ABC transporter substrate-binding protein n=1 Tax=Streptomyces sp. NRRL WC-3742 TaxID=1463934 RepID=UPI00068983A6|nr:extracellular solute-binding protein [Streptomyces sp. NRRL WC-3742]
MRSTSSKPARAGALAAALFVLATACTTTSSGSSGGDGKHVTYWSMWTQTEPQAKVLQKAIDAFTAKTGIHVDVQWQGRKVLDKVAPALLSGNAPDLVDQGFDRLLPALAANGKAQDLSSVLAMDTGEGRKVGEVLPAKFLDVLPKGKDGTPWMIPYESVSVSLFYNGKDPLVARAPKTWDDLLAVCKAAKAAGKACIGTDGDQGWASQYWFDYLLNRNGGSVATLAADRTGAAFKDPAVLRSAQQVEQLVKEGYLAKGYDATKYPEQQNHWAHGESVFFLMGSWLPSETEKFRDAGFEVRSVAFPTTGDATRNAADFLPFGFTIPKGARNADSAGRFIAFFLQKDQLAGISTEARNIAPRTEIPAPAELADVAQQLKDRPSRLPDDNADADWQDKVLVAQYDKLWLGKADAAGFVDQAAKASADYWTAKG